MPALRKYRGGWQAIPFLMPIDFSIARRKIPKVAAGPCGPRDAVINVETAS